MGVGTIGSNNTGDLMMPKALQEVNDALAVLNNKDLYARLRGSDFMIPFMREVFGQNGYTEEYKEIEVYGREGGDRDFRDTDTRKEVSFTKVYKSVATTLGDADFTARMLEEADEKGIPFETVVSKRMEAISKWFTTRYLVYKPYIALLETPTAGGGYYDKDGALRDVVVSESKLKPGYTSATRNHWWAIASGSGVTSLDIEAVVEYMTEYVDTNDADIICYGSRQALAQIYKVYSDTVNQDEFWRTGQPAKEVAGVLFIQSDLVPKDTLMFVNGNADHLISVLRSDNSNYRGLDIYKENGIIKFEDEMELVGSKFKVHAEGYQMTGREDVLFLDINTSRADAGRAMQAGGFTNISNFRQSLINQINDSLRF